MRRSLATPLRFERFEPFERITFLIDASGKVAHVWKDVDPGVHADEVLTTAKGLP